MRNYFKVTNLSFSLCFIVVFSSMLFLGCTTNKTKKEFNKINKTDFAINRCPCDSECYTDEVTNLRCDKKMASFDSNGLPDKSHTIMKGIIATNQQIPLEQNFNAASKNSVRIILNPEIDDYNTATDAGAIGIAINGVPLFDPSTQAKKHAVTGKRPHTLDKGELDECGGHAGRGDDYHYHIAPKCLIEEMGPEQIEIEKKPIGYAKDGFSIHALGWFDSKNDIEEKLDVCRGIKDSSGLYFYNVKTKSKWDLIGCYSGEVHETGPRGQTERRDHNGSVMSGLIPIKYVVSDYYFEEYGGQKCHFLEGRINNEKLMTKNGEIIKNYEKDGTIFYCNSMCYAHFVESSKRMKGGRILDYEFVNDNCPNKLNLSKLRLFDN